MLYIRLQLLPASGLRPDVVTYNLAISACRAARQSTLSREVLDQAFALLAEMRAAGVDPDLATFTTLMALCKQAGAARRALALYEVHTQVQFPASPLCHGQVARNALADLCWFWEVLQDFYLWCALASQRRC